MLFLSSMASINSIFLPPLLDREINVYPWVSLGNPPFSRTSVWVKKGFRVFDKLP
jgi:hypothetical protein